MRDRVRIALHRHANTRYSCLVIAQVAPLHAWDISAHHDMEVRRHRPLALRGKRPSFFHALQARLFMHYRRSSIFIARERRMERRLWSLHAAFRPICMRRWCRLRRWIYAHPHNRSKMFLARWHYNERAHLSAHWCAAILPIAKSAQRALPFRFGAILCRHISQGRITKQPRCYVTIFACESAIALLWACAVAERLSHRRS